MGWYEDAQAEYEQKWGGGGSAAGAPKPLAGAEPPGFWETTRRRLHYLNQGNFGEAFDSDVDPIPEEQDSSWFGGIGRASRAGLNALGGLQELTTTLPFRKAMGLGDKSDIRLSDLFQNDPQALVNPGRLILELQKKSALTDAMKASQGGNDEAALQAIQKRRTEGGFAGGATRAVAEFGLDPTLPLSFGKKVGLAILPALVEAGVKGPVQWIQRASQEGVTQELLSELPQTAAMSVMAALGVKGQQQAWSPKVAQAAAQAKATEAAKAQADQAAAMQPFQVEGLRSPGSPEELAALQAQHRPVDPGVLTPEADNLLHGMMNEILPLANEAVVNRQDPMLRPMGEGELPLPQRVEFGDTLPDGTAFPDGAKAAVLPDGTIVVSPYGRAWILQAPDAASVARRASELIAHEVQHPSQEFGRPTGLVDPLTGQPLEGGANPETGHARGARVQDDRLSDLNVLQGEFALRKILNQHPRVAEIAGAVQQGGRLNKLYQPEGLETATTGTYSPEVLSLAHELGMVEGEKPYGFIEAASDLEDGSPQISSQIVPPHRMAASGGSKRPGLGSVFTHPRDPRIKAALEAEKARQFVATVKPKVDALSSVLPENRQAAANPQAMTPPAQSIFERLAGLPRNAMGALLGKKIQAPPPEPVAAPEGKRGLTGLTKGQPKFAGDAGMEVVQKLANDIREGRVLRNQAAMEAAGFPVGSMKQYWQGFWNLQSKFRKQHGADAPLPPELQAYHENLKLIRGSGTRVSGMSPRQLGTSPRAERGRDIAQQSELTSKERSKRSAGKTEQEVRAEAAAAKLEKLLQDQAKDEKAAAPKLARLTKLQQDLGKADAASRPAIRQQIKNTLSLLDPRKLSAEQRRAYDDAAKQAEAAAEPAAAEVKPEAPKTVPMPTPVSTKRKAWGGKLSGGSKRKAPKAKAGERPAEQFVIPKGAASPAAARFFDRIRGLAQGEQDLTRDDAAKQLAAPQAKMQPPPAPSRTTVGKTPPPEEFPFQQPVVGKEPAPFKAEDVEVQREVGARKRETDEREYLPKQDVKQTIPAARAAKARAEHQEAAFSARQAEVSKVFEESKKQPSALAAIQYIQEKLGKSTYVRDKFGRLKWHKGKKKPVSIVQRWEKGELSVDDLQDFAHALNEAGITDFKDAPPWAHDLAKWSQARGSLRPGTLEQFREAMGKALKEIEWKRPAKDAGAPEVKGFVRVKNLPRQESEASTDVGAVKQGSAAADEAAHARLFGREAETGVTGAQIKSAIEGIVTREGRLTSADLKRAGYSAGTRYKLMTAYHKLLRRYKAGDLQGRYMPGEDGKLYQEMPELYAVRALRRLSTKLVSEGKKAGPQRPGVKVSYPAAPHPSRVTKTVSKRRWHLTDEAKQKNPKLAFHEEPLEGKTQTLESIQDVLGVKLSPEEAEKFWEAFGTGPVEAGAKRQLFSSVEALSRYVSSLKEKRGKLLDYRKWVKNPKLKIGHIRLAIAQRKAWDKLARLSGKDHKLLAHEVSLRLKRSDPVAARKITESPGKYSRQQLLDLVPKGLSEEDIFFEAKNATLTSIDKMLRDVTKELNSRGIDFEKGYVSETSMVPVRNRTGTETMQPKTVSVFRELKAAGYEYPELQGSGGKVARGSIPDLLNFAGPMRAMPTGGRKGGKAPTFDEEALKGELAEKGSTKGREGVGLELEAGPSKKEVAQQADVVDVEGEKLEAFKATKKEAAERGLTGLEKETDKLGTIKTNKVGMGPYMGAKRKKRSLLEGTWNKEEGFTTARFPRPGSKPAQAEPGRMAAFDEAAEKASPDLPGVDLDMSPAAKEFISKVDGFKIGRPALNKYVETLVEKKKILDADVPAVMEKLLNDIKSREAASTKRLRTSADPLKFSKKPWPLPAKFAGANKRKSLPGVPAEAEDFANLSKNKLPKDSATDVKERSLIMTVGGWLNLPRPLLTAIDASNPFRQTWQLTSEQIVRDLSQLATGKVDDTSFLKNTFEMLKSMKSDDTYQKIKASLEADSWYQLGENIGLEYATKDHPNESFAGKDAFDKLMDKVVIFKPLKSLVAASERGFQIYQNRAMRDGLKHYMEAMQAHKRSKGSAEPLTIDEMRDAVEHINTAASRAQIFKDRKWNEAVNLVLYSGQMNWSRIKMLNRIFNPTAPAFMSLSSPASRHAARMQTLRAFAGGAAMAGAVYSIAAVQGLAPEVETDPRSTDFGKVRVGNATFDAWGGNQQFIRAAWQAWSGKQKERSTGLLKDRTLADTLSTFVRSKFGPGASLVWNFVDKKNLQGETTHVGFDSKDNVAGATNLLKDIVLPMSVADTIDLWKENPKFAWTIPLMLMGEGLSAGGGPKEKWLEDRSTAGILTGKRSERRAKDSQNMKEFRRFGITPPRLGGKVTLPGRDKYGRRNYYNMSLAEKQEFEAEYMPVVTDLLNDLINSSTYQKLPDDAKRVKLFKYVHKLNSKYGAAKRGKKILAERYKAGEVKPSNRQPGDEDA